MPTIAEIIAAKKANINLKVDLLGQSTADRVVLMSEGPHHAKLVDSTGRFIKWLPKPESLAEKMAAKEAIDRIDPPGKSERATAARKSAGLILSKELPNGPETRGQATPIAGPEEPRALGARVGEALTVVPDEPTPQGVAWDAILNRWETDLVIMADPAPGSEAAWIALKPGTGGGLPVMLHKLPFWPHPQRQQTEDEPY